MCGRSVAQICLLKLFNSFTVAKSLLPFIAILCLIHCPGVFKTVCEVHLSLSKEKDKCTAFPVISSQ